MIYGLVAAMGWGLSDLWATISGRRIGSFRTVVVAQIAAAIAISLMALAARADLSGLSSVTSWLAVNAFISAAAFTALYRALELGPIAIVSPVLATYAVVPVLLSVILLGESLGAWELAGVTVTITGAIFASTDIRAIRAGARTPAAGLPLAVVSMLLFGVATYVTGWAAQQAGWLPSLLFGRLTMAAVFVIAAIVVRFRTPPGAALERPAPSAMRLAVLVGLLELFGTISYARGAEVGMLSIVTAASATYPLIPVIGGVILFHERPAPTQFVGVALVIGGLMLLGLS